MSTITFNRAIRIANILTDADSLPTIIITRLDTNVVVQTSTAMTHGTTGLYSYSYASAVNDVTYRGAYTIIVNGQTISSSSDITAGATASGDIITEQDVSDFLGSVGVEILSQQDVTATTTSDSNVQRAINKAEARTKAILGNNFKIPLAVSGTAIKSATSSISYPLLVAACCQYAGYWLDKWRSVQALESKKYNPAAITALACAWEEVADADLRQMVRWAQGYDSGLAVDLDLSNTAPRNNERSINAVQMQVPRERICW